MQRTLTIATISAALMISIGCGSTTTTPNPAPKTTATTAPTPTPKPTETHAAPKLTAEQIANNNKAVMFAVNTAEATHTVDDTLVMPKWVADHYREFGKEDYTREKAAFQRPFGWGTGSYRGKQFYWFAYTNTDAWLQFDLSIALANGDMDKIRARKDGYGHAGAAELVTAAENKEFYAPGTVTWLGTTNYWTETRCVQPDFEPCDIGGALDDEIARLNKDLSPSLTFTTKSRFTW